MHRLAPVGVIDRRGEEREEPESVERALAHQGTLVLAVRGDSAPLSGSDHPALHWIGPGELPGHDVVWAFLGRDDEGTAVLAALLPGDDDGPRPPGGWGVLREIGAALPDAEADALITAVSLGRFLGEAFCPACGARTDLAMAGWARRCTGCSREHFPRTDPAVIVAIESEDGERLLLGANAAWRGRMYSCFAGFVEAGETLESAIHREVWEEAGVRLRDVRYVASQPWPYPRSLMLGFRAVAVADDEARADGSEIVDVRWFDRGEIRDGLAGRGETGLPGAASIAHRLIRSWAFHGERGSAGTAR